MKKLTLLGVVSAVLFLANVTFAQHVRTDFGLKGGVNLASLKTGGNSTESRTGFHVGGLAHIHLSPAWAIQPEVMYSSQGAEYASGRADKINYINVPVLGQYMFANGLRLQTGPQIGFLTSAKNENGHTEVDLKNTLKKTDLSWSFGAGYMTRSGLGIDARYNYGINNISRSNPERNNRVWQFGVFYQFGR